METITEKLGNASENLVKPLRNEKGQLLPNQASLNPAGKPPGTNNFETDFDEAVKEIAKDNNMTRSEARKLLLKVAYKNAKDGNYSFYKDIHDRIYGQPKSVSEVNLSGDLKIEFSKDFDVETPPKLDQYALTS